MKKPIRLRGWVMFNLVKRKIPGIGPKLASRLITELKDKVGELRFSEGIQKETGVQGDVISALLNLGYKRNEIDEHISEIESIAANENEIETALKESLKLMKRV